MKLSKKLLSLLLCAIMVLGSVAIGGNGFAEVLDAFSVKASAAKVTSYSQGDIIEFGWYPQSKETNKSITDALTSSAGNTLGWNSYDYYSGTGEWDDGQMTPSKYMRYTDVMYGSTKYRGVVFDSYRPYYTGHQSTTSTSPQYQEGNGYTCGNIYWFKYEPIKWRVLDPATGMVMAETILDSQAFNNYVLYANSEYYGNSAKTYYANNYTESSIRKWLNDDFYNTAFSPAQQNIIQNTTLDNSAYSASYSEYNSESANDKIYLLSRNDACNTSYGFSSSESTHDTSRRAKGSDYAKCQGLYVCKSSGSEYDGNSYWWLRTRYSYDGDYSYNYAYYVYRDGEIYLDYLNVTSIGVRPALKLNLASEIFQSDVENTEITGKFEDYETEVIKNTGKSYVSKIKIDGKTYNVSQSYSITETQAESFKGYDVIATLEGEVITNIKFNGQSTKTVLGTLKEYITCSILNSNVEKTYVSEINVDGKSYPVPEKINLTKYEAEAMKGKKVTVVLTNGEVTSVMLSTTVLFSLDDGWNFANSEYSFSNGNESYIIPYESYVKAFGKSYVETVDIDTDWGGNCFGMSASAILFKTGALQWSNYNKLGDKTFYKPNEYYFDLKHDLGIPINNYRTTAGYGTPVTQIIEILQLINDGNIKTDWNKGYFVLDKSKYTTVLGRKVYNYEHDSNGKYIENMLNILTTAQFPYVISMDYSDGAHAIVARTDKRPEDQGNGWWKVYVYNPNSPKMPDSMGIKDNYLIGWYINSLISSGDDDYIELNPSENKWRYNTSGNSSKEKQYVGCDADGNVLLKSSVQGGEIICQYPEFLYLEDVRNMKTNYNIPNDWSSKKTSSIKIKYGDNFDVLDDHNKVVANVVNGFCVCIGDGIQYTPVCSASGNPRDNTVIGTVDINLPSFSIKYYSGNIQIIGYDKVIGIKSDSECTASISDENTKVIIDSDKDCKIDAQVSNIISTEKYDTCYLSGDLDKTDTVELTIDDDSNLNLKGTEGFAVSIKNETKDTTKADVEQGELNIRSELNPTAKAKIKVATERTIDYRSIVTITATATDVPEGYKLVLYVNGSKAATGDNKTVSYSVGELKSDVNYTVKVVDAKGNIQKDSNGNELSKDGGKITCNAGFFKKLIAFFKGLFGSLPKVEVKPQ